MRLDTFPKEPSTVFYIGSNDPHDLTEVRRHLLAKLPRPAHCRWYIHRTAFDIGEKYGKDTFLVMTSIGTAKVPAAFAMKSRVDGFFERFGLRGVTDKVIQALMNLLPSHLPARMREYRDRYEHHLLVRVSNDTAGSTRAFLQPSTFTGSDSGAYFECDADEGRKAFLRPLCRGRCRRSATARRTAAASRISWRWISPCAATTATGSKRCRRNVETAM